jgi:hypothetical protein
VDAGVAASEELERDAYEEKGSGGGAEHVSEEKCGADKQGSGAEE